MTTKQNMIENIASLGEVSRETAARVFDVYESHGVMVCDVVSTGFSVTHGVFMEKDQIRHVAGTFCKEKEA